MPGTIAVPNAINVSTFTLVAEAGFRTKQSPGFLGDRFPAQPGDISSA